MGTCVPAQRRDLSLNDAVTSNMNKFELQKYIDILAYKFDSGVLFEFAQDYSQCSQTTVKKNYQRQLMLEFKRFLFLICVCFTENGGKRFDLSPREVTPSPLVDRIWRLVISNTQTYARFCNKFLKRQFLHRESKNMLQLTKYDKTLEFYDYYFGRPNLAYWPPFSNVESLRHAHQGFLLLSVEGFVDLHEQFERDMKMSKNVEGVHKRYTSQISKLREEELLDMAELEVSILGKQTPKSKKSSIVIRKKNFEVKTSAKRRASLELDKVSEEGDSEDEEDDHWWQLRNNASLLISASMIQRYEKAMNMRPDRIQVPRNDNVDDSINSEFLSEDEEDNQDTLSRSESGDQRPSFLTKILKQDPLDMLKSNWKASKFHILAKLKLYRVPDGVVRAYKIETNTTDALSKAVFEELQRFLLLAAISTVRLQPSACLREAWRYFVIETQRYEKYCNSIFGLFLHSDARSSSTLYEATKRLYKRVFDMEPNVHFWPSKVNEKSRRGPDFKFINVIGCVTQLLTLANLFPSPKPQKARQEVERSHALLAVAGYKLK